MTQLSEAITRYHKILESAPYQDLGWAEALQAKMAALRLGNGGRPVCPFLRPHFVTRKQFAGLAKAGEALAKAAERVKDMALANPALMARMELLPAEKMLASIDPGYSYFSVAAALDSHVDGGHIWVVGYNADAPSGIAYGEALADVFYDCPPVKEFRKKYSLQKTGGMKHLLQALLKAWKSFGGKQKPRIAMLEFRQQFQTSDSGELILIKEFLQREGYQALIAVPDQLEYKNGVLRQGDFVIDLLYRRVLVEEFLVRFDLGHPLVRAYQERAVCVVNSFRAELAQKKAIFDLLTDDSVTAGFPAAERKALREFIPWTRVVSQRKTTYGDETVDLPEFILKNREKLVLKPNNSTGDLHCFNGWEMDSNAWERALRSALRTPYVVQERVPAVIGTFPVYLYGSVELRPMRIDVHPHTYLGKVQGCSAWLTADTPSGFTTVAGPAPTFIVEPK
jgi:uncharacterized circularly permuted ATP-grasp superfamily protein